ncbi:MAG: 16S rRNA processing protein RimM [Deltaproteobacteria bacterium]|nr:16S rRNA processing protein RimM [Deltaproteobacteria bacterium]
MDWFEIGTVLKPRGLKGQMRCISHLESNSLGKIPEKICIRTPGGKDDSYRLREITFAGKFFFLSLEGIDSPESVRPLAGNGVLVTVDALVPLEEGEYYWRDVIGMEVVTEAGESLGEVKEIFSTGSHDVYVCRGKAREILLPAIADVVLQIDLPEKRMVVRLLAGL